MGPAELQVNMDRLECFWLEEHVDNPKDYVDNLDAYQHGRRLPGPVDQRRELSLNSQTGPKLYHI